jgi:AcrR family transcriptional regulator
MSVASAAASGPSSEAASGEERFCARFDDCAERLLAAIEEACASEREWPLRAWAAILAALAFLSRDPAAAATLLLDAPAGGAQARARHSDLQRRLESMLREGRRRSTQATSPPPFAESLLIAGALATVADRLRSAEAAGLLELAAPLAEVLLLPSLGASGARKAVAAASERYSQLQRARETSGDFRPLSRGPHRMPATEVEADQRRRLLAAAGELLGERGAAGVTVARLTARAKVSKRTFYDNFANSRECVWAAYEDARDRLWQAGSEAAGESGWAAQVRAASAAALEFFADEPAGVHLLGPAGIGADHRIAQAQRKALAAVAALLREGRAHFPSAAELPAATERVLIEQAAAVVEVVLQDGAPERLPALAPRLAELLLSPYLDGATGTAPPPASAQPG